MERDRTEAEAKIAELLTIADTAAKKSEVETRDLKTKLRRLEVETQPIIDRYKVSLSIIYLSTSKQVHVAW